MAVLPDHDRELVHALTEYLQRVTEILGPAHPKTGFGDTLPLVVALKALRTAVAIVVLVDRGYADEAGALLRSLAAGTITFAALTSEDSESRGYLYARHGRDRDLKMIDSMRTRREVIAEREKDLPQGERTVLLSDEQMLAVRARVEDLWNHELAVSLGDRPEPEPLGRNRGTWSGLDDAELAKRAGALEIYRGIYDVASDPSHLLFPTIRSVLRELGEKGMVTIGPTYASAAYVAMGLRDCVSRLATDAVRHYHLDSAKDELVPLHEKLSSAIRRYTVSSGDQASMKRARELMGEPASGPDQ